MNFKALLESKLQALGQSYTILGNEIRTTCMNPDHNDNNPSYFININTGVSHCFSCNYSPHPAKLIDADEADIEELLRNAKYSYLESQLKDESETEKVSFTLPPKAYDIDRDWRGVSKDLLLKLGVYYCDTGRYAGRLIFPIYKDDLLLGFDARIVNPSIVPDSLKDVKWLRPKGMETQKIVYPYNLLKTMDCNWVVITEGVMDAVSYLELGIPAIPSFGVSEPHPDRITQLLSLGVSTIGLGLDNDEAGQKASLNLYKHYIKWFNIKNHIITSQVRKVGVKDCNEYLTKIKGV